MKEREKFSSRLGFILISAGCAIGLGNVWRFPYVVGQYGGALFVLIYLFFLIALKNSHYVFKENHFHPLTAPAVSPSIRFFPSSIKISNVGIVTIIDAAPI